MNTNKNIITQNLNPNATKILHYDTNTNITTFMLPDNTLDCDEMKVVIDTWVDILNTQNQDKINQLNQQIQSTQTDITNLDTQITNDNQLLDQAFANKQLDEATRLTSIIKDSNSKKVEITKTLNSYKEELSKLSTNTTSTTV